MRALPQLKRPTQNGGIFRASTVFLKKRSNDFIVVIIHVNGTLRTLSTENKADVTLHISRAI
jgi:hypothetical protein